MRHRSKKKNQRSHAKTRAMERYGISYNRHVLARIISMISNNETKLLEKKSLRLSVRECILDDRTVKFVYDRERKEIVTFLPLFDKKEEKEQEIKQQMEGKFNYMELGTVC